MMCETPKILRNWEYSWSDNENWIWPVSDKLEADIKVRGVDSIHVRCKTIKQFMSSVMDRLNVGDKPSSETWILVSTTSERITITSEERATFIEIASTLGSFAHVVDAKHKIIASSDESMVGKQL
jgi:hypothetical protein